MSQKDAYVSLRLGGKRIRGQGGKDERSKSLICAQSRDCTQRPCVVQGEGRWHEVAHEVG